MSVKLKMSSSYHLETDGSSERLNKTVIQSLCYYVERNQKGWVKALPLVHFNLMNTANVSTGFSLFQLRMGHSPRLIPPISNVEQSLVTQDLDMHQAMMMLELITLNVAEAKDNLLMAKVAQAHFANQYRGKEVVYAVGEKVMLSAEHRQCKYMQAHSGRVVKFMLQFDGPFPVIKAHPERSSYTLELPNKPDRFPTFHALLLHKHVPNDDKLFPSCKLDQPGPVVTPDGEQEWFIDQIIDEHAHGRGCQFLVQWHGWGPEGYWGENLLTLKLWIAGCVPYTLEFFKVGESVMAAPLRLLFSDRLLLLDILLTI